MEGGRSRVETGPYRARLPDLGGSCAGTGRVGNRQVDDLADLSARGVVVLAEVRARRAAARFARATTVVAADDPVARRRLDGLVERRVRDYVLERAICGWWVDQAPAGG